MQPFLKVDTYSPPRSSKFECLLMDNPATQACPYVTLDFSSPHQATLVGDPCCCGGTVR